MTRRKIAAIDFDGVIKPSVGRGYESPDPECAETLAALKADGWKLILWTCRAGRRLTAALNYLERHGLSDYFDAVNENVQPMRYQVSRKVVAAVYIDDHALGGFSG